MPTLISALNAWRIEGVTSLSALVRSPSLLFSTIGAATNLLSDERPPPPPLSVCRLTRHIRVWYTCMKASFQRWLVWVEPIYHPLYKNQVIVFSSFSLLDTVSLMDLGEGSPQPYTLISLFFTFVMCQVGAPLNDPPGTMLEGSTSGAGGAGTLSRAGRKADSCWQFINKLRWINRIREPRSPSIKCQIFSLIARERKWQWIKRLKRLLYRYNWVYSRKYSIVSGLKETWFLNGGAKKRKPWATPETDHIS